MVMVNRNHKKSGKRKPPSQNQSQTAHGETPRSICEKSHWFTSAVNQIYHFRPAENRDLQYQIIKLGSSSNVSSHHNVADLGYVFNDVTSIATTKASF